MQWFSNTQEYLWRISLENEAITFCTAASDKIASLKEYNGTVRPIFLMFKVRNCFLIFLWIHFCSLGRTKEGSDRRGELASNKSRSGKIGGVQIEREINLLCLFFSRPDVNSFRDIPSLISADSGENGHMPILVAKKIVPFFETPAQREGEERCS